MANPVEAGVARRKQFADTEIEAVFLEHYDLVYRAAYRVTGNGNDAEDALQTLFLRLVRTPPDLARKNGWAPYLHRAAINVGLDIVRRRARNVSLAGMESWIEESGPGPHRTQQSAELGARLRQALAAMNPRAAEVFVLRHIEGYSNRDIAGMLDTSTGSIAVTLFRARSHLRKSLRSFRGGQ